MSCGTCDAGEDCPIHGGDIELAAVILGSSASRMTARQNRGFRGRNGDGAL